MLMIQKKQIQPIQAVQKRKQPYWRMKVWHIKRDSSRYNHIGETSGQREDVPFAISSTRSFLEWS